MDSTNVYVLRQEGGKFYVGKTANLERRFEQHMSGHGAAWTQLHKPTGVEKVFHNVPSSEEGRITKEYMRKYGAENVRGGGYTQRYMSQERIDRLNSKGGNLLHYVGLLGAVVAAYELTRFYNEKRKQETEPDLNDPSLLQELLAPVGIVGYGLYLLGKRMAGKS